LAIAEKQLDDVSRSAQLLQQVVALEPANTDAQYLLGQDLAKMGKNPAPSRTGEKRSNSIRNTLKRYIIWRVT
jgi:hypothetical protein